MIMKRRKDKRGRVLNVGESQRADGKYTYQYTNMKGERKSVYSWRLIPSDVTPAGKRKDLSLREKEKMIQRDISDGIIPDGDGLTVIELVKQYVEQKQGVRHNTEAGYKFVINVLAKESLGEKRIDRVKLSDAKRWLIKLQDDGKGYSSIHLIRSVLKPAFQTAVDDDLIRKNPFDFCLATVVINDSKKREALTREEMNVFLDFVKNDKHFSRYYDAIAIMFNTGLRISEFCGLTKSDIDMENRTINVDHQLQRKANMEYIIEKTKTSAGARRLPMSQEVYECFGRILKARRKAKKEPIVDGYGGFLFLDKNNMPMVALHWQHFFQHIRQKYNKIYKKPMPYVTPHICRHTYCSNMAKSGMNPKTLQYLMGHSNIGITLNTYTHIGFEDARAEVIALQNGEKLKNARKSV